MRPAGTDSWLAALEARHLADLTFPEVARSLRALSATYVERRDRLRAGGALSGAGKRAAFALFYGSIHYLLIAEIVKRLPGATEGAAELVDLGCGTGAAGAAWAASCHRRPRILGVDRHPWALAEAARTYRELGLRARTIRADAAAVALPKSSALLLAAYTLNELGEDARRTLLGRFLDRAARGDRVLVVEPLAGFVSPWWGSWRQSVTGAGGRADEWRIRVKLPPIVARLDRAAGLDHRELTGRSLFL
jgi:SAM-dependent methyltransferase